jgi:hypothetical protein
VQISGLTIQFKDGVPGKKGNYYKPDGTKINNTIQRSIVKKIAKFKKWLTSSLIKK